MTLSFSSPGIFDLIRLWNWKLCAGVLEKVGVEPQYERIGKYKSFGDTITRKDMSEANREMLTALLDDIHDNWLEKVASSKGRSRQTFFLMACPC